MKAILLFSVASLLQADFSYSSMQKMTGGMAASLGGGDKASKVFLKGQKMKMDMGDTVTILDLGPRP